jgi:ParB-like chromosome segregation protein Spo0J
MADQANVEVVSIESLTPDAANVVRRDDRARKSLAASLRQFGPARSIVLDGKGIIRAGNGTVEAAQEAGCTEVLIVKPKPGQLVAVQRDDWSPTEATAYGVADNRLGDLKTYDDGALAGVLESLGAEGFNLDAIGFTADEIEELIGGDQDAIAEGDFPAYGEPDSHSIVLRYKKDDVPTLLEFLGESDDSVLVEGKAGAKILERIRQVAQS